MKTFITFLLLFVASFAYGGQVTISQLPAAPSVSSTTSFPAEVSGTTMQVTAQQIASFANGSLPDNQIYVASGMFYNGGGGDERLHIDVSRDGLTWTDMLTNWSQPIRDPSIVRDQYGTFWCGATVGTIYGGTNAFVLGKSTDLKNWTTVGFIQTIPGGNNVTTWGAALVIDGTGTMHALVSTGTTATFNTGTNTCAYELHSLNPPTNTSWSTPVMQTGTDPLSPFSALPQGFNQQGTLVSGTYFCEAQFIGSTLHRILCSSTDFVNFQPVSSTDVAPRIYDDTAFDTSNQVDVQMPGGLWRQYVNSDNTNPTQTGYLVARYGGYGPGLFFRDLGYDITHPVLGPIIRTTQTTTGRVPTGLQACNGIIVTSGSGLNLPVMPASYGGMSKQEPNNVTITGGTQSGVTYPAPMNMPGLTLTGSTVEVTYSDQLNIPADNGYFTGGIRFWSDTTRTTNGAWMGQFQSGDGSFNIVMPNVGTPSFDLLKPGGFAGTAWSCDSGGNVHNYGNLSVDGTGNINSVIFTGTSTVVSYNRQLRVAEDTGYTTGGYCFLDSANSPTGGLMAVYANSGKIAIRMPHGADGSNGLRITNGADNQTNMDMLDNGNTTWTGAHTFDTSVKVGSAGVTITNLRHGTATLTSGTAIIADSNITPATEIYPSMSGTVPVYFSHTQVTGTATFTGITTGGTGVSGTISYLEIQP